MLIYYSGIKELKGLGDPTFVGCEVSAVPEFSDLDKEAWQGLSNVNNHSILTG